MVTRHGYIRRWLISYNRRGWRHRSRRTFWVSKFIYLCNSYKGAVGLILKQFFSAACFSFGPVNWYFFSFGKENLQILSVTVLSGPHFYQRYSHTWTPSEIVTLISGPLCAWCYTHTWTPFLQMLHLYLDPILKNVTLVPWPHSDQCYSHTWTLTFRMLHSYLDPIIINVTFIPGPHL